MSSALAGLTYLLHGEGKVHYAVPTCGFKDGSEFRSDYLGLYETVFREIGSEKIITPTLFKQGHFFQDTEGELYFAVKRSLGITHAIKIETPCRVSQFFVISNEGRYLTEEQLWQLSSTIAKDSRFDLDLENFQFSLDEDSRKLMRFRVARLLLKDPCGRVFLYHFYIFLDQEYHLLRKSELWDDIGYLAGESINLEKMKVVETKESELKYLLTCDSQKTLTILSLKCERSDNLPGECKLFLHQQTSLDRMVKVQDIGSFSLVTTEQSLLIISSDQLKIDYSFPEQRNEQVKQYLSLFPSRDVQFSGDILLNLIDYHEAGNVRSICDFNPSSHYSTILVATLSDGSLFRLCCEDKIVTRRHELKVKKFLGFDAAIDQNSEDLVSIDKYGKIQDRYLGAFYYLG